MSSTAIQVFPSGKCYTYEGDIHGPATQRRLKVDYQRAARWRKGTAKEWKAIKVQTLAEMYVSRDVLACMSALVDDLIKEDHEGFQVDDMTNLTPDPSDWDITECEAYCDEHGIDTADAIGLSGYRDLVRDNAEQAEVYEWWLVTKWLHGKLSAIGEVTIDNGYGYFWGRCTTGQSMIMDGVFQRIAQEFAEN